MALRVLLITPEFYGIEKLIKSILEESGNEVIWIENRTLKFDYHGTEARFRFIRKLYFFIFFPHVRYIRNELMKIRDIRFDIIFSINGFIICSYLFKKLKSKNPSLFSVLYLWDSFSKYSWKKELKYFRKVYTFDKSDSEKYGIEYKPNFYVRSENKDSHEQEFDLFFAGKFSSDRLSIVDNLLSQSKNSSLKYFVKLWPAYKIFPHNRLVYILLQKINFKSNWVINYLLNFEAYKGILKRKYIIAESLSHEDIQPYFLRTNVILDLPYRGQSGYTHLLIEALANGKKVITSNSNISEEKFFNTEQIHITDNYNLEVDLNWIRAKQTFKIDNFFSDLELSQWLKSIINVGIA